MTSISNLARLSAHAYGVAADLPFTLNVGDYSEIHFDEDINFWGNGTGFTGHAYFSLTDNTLVTETTCQHHQKWAAHST